MRGLTLGIFAVCGCTSTWQIQPGEQLVVSCEGQARYYTDSDQDGWGDPEGEDEVLCRPDYRRALTAVNDLDCDDRDPAVTGRVGTLCPDQLVYGQPAHTHGGVGVGDMEFAFVHDKAAAVSFAEAPKACADWGAHSLVGDDLRVEGVLASFHDLGEVIGVQQAVAESGSPMFSGFVGIRWEGDWETGAWSWEDDAAPDVLIDLLGWCGGEAPALNDFYPNAHAADPAYEAAIEVLMDQVRIAMVLSREGSWCLGLPTDAYAHPMEEGPYSVADAHFICERPRPSPADYDHR